ncbi:MAG: hypothetical protein H0W61_17745 [Bacteroidetes bacterium]|nr:hypothetical protein [Bacteroidota bacterium]
MKALKQIVVRLLALLLVLAGTSCASVKKANVNSKGLAYSPAHQHLSKSKLKYKI